jgi:hypothetical protein
MGFRSSFEWLKGEENEHLDDTICGSTDCLDRRFHCFSRGGRVDSLTARLRSDLLDPAFFDWWQKDSLE